MIPSKMVGQGILEGIGKREMEDARIKCMDTSAMTNPP